jgi:hypothetical protein
LIPEVVINVALIGGEARAACHVRNRTQSVGCSDVDLLRDLDRGIMFDAELAHGAFDRATKPKLHYWRLAMLTDGSALPS